MSFLLNVIQEVCIPIMSCNIMLFFIGHMLWKSFILCVRIYVWSVCGMIVFCLFLSFRSSLCYMVLIMVKQCSWCPVMFAKHSANQLCHLPSMEPLVSIRRILPTSWPMMKLLWYACQINDTFSLIQFILSLSLPMFSKSWSGEDELLKCVFLGTLFVDRQWH